MEYQVNNDSLMHYGVLGMKWGVRNAETRAKYASDGKLKASKRTIKKDYKRVYDSEYKKAAVKNKVSEKAQKDYDATRKLEDLDMSGHNGKIYGTKKWDKVSRAAENASYKYEKAKRDSRTTAEAAAGKYIANKYSKQSLDKYYKSKKRQETVEVAMAGAAVAAMFVAPVALPIAAWKLK